MTAASSPPPELASGERDTEHAGRMRRIPRADRIPRRIFLVDAGGALVTFLALLLVLRPLPVFGTPHHILVTLALFAAALCVFSTTSFTLPASRRRACLSIVIAANALYACTTVVLLLGQLSRLTPFDVAYFGAELIVLAVLVVIELGVLRGATRPSTT